MKRRLPQIGLVKSWDGQRPGADPRDDGRVTRTLIIGGNRRFIGGNRRFPP
jgi:hypothetical protein